VPLRLRDTSLKRNILPAIAHDVMHDRGLFFNPRKTESSQAVLEILEKAKDSIKNFNEKSREEALWLHFLSIIEFWQKDESPSFEKTDLFIEKTIDTGFVWSLQAGQTVFCVSMKLTSR
jgi:hypothetical protein